MAQTKFRGEIESIDDLAQYFDLIKNTCSYNKHDRFGVTLSSQGGDISLLLMKKNNKYVLSYAYFSQDKDFSDEDLEQGVKFVYKQVKEVFRNQPVIIKGYIEPHISKTIIPIRNCDLTYFILELMKTYDHDTREIQTVSTEEAKKITEEEDQKQDSETGD